ncbi:uncharacterized protein EI90DRAFT_2478227 [Cantharellus anzutake]|uniref:uncharacterized protein n=1 Tax=Cantharellus anzutake TaxID=1750568 RepID=UPI0019041CB3|nr:uncharacterized protein EI90DRAFT_2478227 [Cantharellus anzutake]KAF8322812.1 hypothetical protein EI90DRAFT_2478227 [Cantharellus anzutake]
MFSFPFLHLKRSLALLFTIIMYGYQLIRSAFLPMLSPVSSFSFPRTSNLTKWDLQVLVWSSRQRLVFGAGAEGRPTNIQPIGLWPSGTAARDPVLDQFPSILAGVVLRYSFPLFPFCTPLRPLQSTSRSSPIPDLRCLIRL